MMNRRVTTPVEPGRGQSICGILARIIHEEDTALASSMTHGILNPRVILILRLAALLLVACCWGASTWASGDPLAVEAARREGLRAVASGDFAAAVGAFERALTFDADNVDILLQLGITRARMGDEASAIESYERLLAIDASHSRALNNLANVFYRRNDFERAAEYYGLALEADPDYLLALLHYGKTEHQLNHPDSAGKAFEHCTSLAAANDRERMLQLDCRYYLGTLSFRSGDYATTAELMEQVLAEQAAHTEARYFLGMSYLRLGRADDGKRQLEIHREILRARRDQAPIEKKRTP
jgi:tetratricopeptide (TPR) repeat protein